MRGRQLELKWVFQVLQRAPLYQTGRLSTSIELRGAIFGLSPAFASAEGVRRAVERR